jgi:uncharacterized protein (TIGR02145 family)
LNFFLVLMVILEKLGYYSMRNCLLISLLWIHCILTAQDLVYTVTAKSGDIPISIDSILVENVSNHTRILFANLPVRKDYVINLTQGTFQGTTESPILQKNPVFTVIRNQPGILAFTTGEMPPERGSLTVYNIKGQKIFEETSIQFSPFHQISLTLGLSGIYLVTVNSGTHQQSVKVLGDQTTGRIELSQWSNLPDVSGLKSGTISNSIDFQFLPGDSIRVSVYKKSLYAYPKSFRINGSNLLPFVFTTNTSNVSGISNAYSDLTGRAVLKSFNPLTGTSVFSFPGNSPGLKYGDIIVAESDTSGYLRKVTGSSEKDGIAVVQTSQAGLHEVFVNKEILLSTQWMDPLLSVTESSSPVLIARALTDNNGFSHPVKIIYHLDGGQIVIKSPLQFPGSDGPVLPFIHAQKVIPNSDIFAQDDFRVSLEDGNVSMSSEASFIFSYKGNGKRDEATKSELGELMTGRIFLSGQGNIKGRLVLSSVKPIAQVVPAQKMLNVQRVTVKYLVEGVPVWVDFVCDMFNRLEIASPGNFGASWSFDETHSTNLGWEYKSDTKTFTPISSCESVNKVSPLIVSSISDASAGVSLYPSTEIMFYGISTMSGESRPENEARFYAKNLSVFAESGTKSFLAWNSLIYSELDNKTGADLTIFGLQGVKYISGEMICTKTNSWKSPEKLVLQTVLPERVNLSSKLTLSFRVTDMAGNPVPGCAVYIQGDGTYSDQVVYSNQSGDAGCEWTVGSKTGFNDFTGQIFNADKQVISAVSDSVEVYDNDAYGTLTYDGKTYKTKKFGNAVWMTENLAYLPSVSPPTPGSNTTPYYYVVGYYGTNAEEAKKVPGYGLYGVMYNWIAATKGETAPSGGNIRGICPSGWHLSGKKDWVDLWTYLVTNGYGFEGNFNQIAKAMASKNKWNTSGISGTPGNDPDKNNASEFSGLPGGFRCTDALNFTDEGNFTSWWATSERDADNAYHWGFFNTNSVLIEYYSLKARGYFVRCVKD